MYDKNGYLDFDRLVQLSKTFNWVVGGRGTGKTFGALSYALRNKISFFLLRKTQIQADLISRPEFSPVNPVADYYDLNVGYAKATKSNSLILLDDQRIGMTGALSTLSNMRGFDASWIDWIIFDEFLGEPQERKMKNESETFFNAYETINRNRELSGREPVKVFALANSNTIDNQYFLTMGCVQEFYLMQERDLDYSISINNEADRLLLNLNRSPISNKKAGTALYKLTQGSRFSEMSLENKFDYSAYQNIKPQPIQEYRPLYGIGELWVYAHKSERKYYICGHRSGSPEHYGLNETDRARFYDQHEGKLVDMFLMNRVVFENMACAIIFNAYFIA